MNMLYKLLFSVVVGIFARESWEEKRLKTRRGRAVADGSELLHHDLLSTVKCCVYGYSRAVNNLLRLGSYVCVVCCASGACHVWCK
jgi:hypothetical protein